jgi:hypothetical protein
MTLKEQHDKLLSEKPEDAVHDSEGCPFCNPELPKDSIGGGDMKTYTEEEFTAAVQEAVAPLQAAADAKVSELETKLDAQSATHAKEEAEGQIAEVQAELDKAEIRVADATKRYDDLVAFLDAAVAEQAEVAARESRKDERIAAVKEVTALSDEKIAERLDRWIAMSDEAFGEMLEDWKMIPAPSVAAEEANEEITAPVETAMSNIREEASSNKSVAADVFAARNAGLDIRNLTN